MAKQNKGRKFFATTATAALVASAIVPVASAAELKDFDTVPAWAKDAVKFLADNDYVQGDENGNFKPASTLLRSQAAEIIAKVQDLEATGTENFGDVDSKHWFYNAVLATSPEIFQGDDKGNFNPNQKLTRQEAAVVIVKAFGLTGSKDLSSFKDASKVPAWAKAQFETAVENGVINGKNGLLAPQDDISNAEFATMIKRAIDAAVPAVTSVSATNAKTLTVAGTALKDLKAEDVTVEGNKVTDVKVAANGKSATLTLETPLVDGQEYKVTTKFGGETKEFTVKFVFVLADVVVTTTSLEANKNKQFLQVTINGAVTDLATIDSLGYDIEFQASKAVFENAGAAATTSSTGEIREEAVAINDTFNVKAVLKKDGKTAESKTVEVTVVSKATPAIGDIVIETSELELTKPVISTKDTGVQVLEVVSNTEDVIDVSGLNSFSSSNPEIALIDASTGVITPIKAGKTTISVKAGNVSYSKEITVVAEERVATKATTSSTVFVAPGATLTTNVTVTDQFGEKVEAADIAAVNIELSERTGELTLVPDWTSTDDGKLPVAITAATAGSYTVVVKDLTTLKNLGQFTVRASADNVADNYKLEAGSKGVINLAGTGTLKISAKEFTKTGGFLRTLPTADFPGTFTVESVNPTVATAAAATDANGDILVTGHKVGTTQIVLKKGGVQVATATVTVKEETPYIESITWKANASTITVAGKEVTYKDIFTITETASTVDEIVEGVKLSVNTTSKVRIDLSNTGAPFLYLDKNDDGDYVAADDEVLGTVSAKVSGAAGETIAVTAPNFVTGILDAATVANDKGTLVIVVTDDDTNLTVRASSTLKFDVK